MNHYKISVIMPIYNAEKFLKRSINSIIKQSIGFENIELILVNDNSTDSTKEIIEEFSKKYSNIKSFHSSENHGYPGYGRNIGLKNATAEYIMFIDNDDEYDIKYCETMLQTITIENCDLVCANFNIQYKHSRTKESCFARILDYSMTEHDNKLIKGKISKIYDSEVWTKIFKRSIIANNNIIFIEKGLNEDSLFIFEYRLYADNIIYIDYYGYTWYRDGENLSKISSKSTLEFINSYYEILNFVDDNYEAFYYNEFYKNVIEATIIRIIYSDDKKFLLEKIYEFEKSVKFKDKLNHKWTTIINNLILKKMYLVVILLLKILRFFKYILDFLRLIKLKFI